MSDVVDMALFFPEQLFNSVLELFQLGLSAEKVATDFERVQGSIMFWGGGRGEAIEPCPGFPVQVYALPQSPGKADGVIESDFDDATCLNTKEEVATSA